MSTCGCAFDQFIAALKGALCMPEFPSCYGGSAVTAYGSAGGGSSLATTITSNGSADTKGAWVELGASTAHDAHWIEIDVTNSSTVAIALLDIGIGAGGSETVIIPDLVVVTKGSPGSGVPYLFPVFIPRGSRVAARFQDIVGGMTLGVSVRLISPALSSGGVAPSVVSAYGATTSSMGTEIDPGGTANTDTSPVEIAGATDRDHRWLVMAGRFGDNSLSSGGCVWRMQILAGASMSETVLIGDIHISAESSADNPFNMCRTFPVFIPRGTRLSVVLRCSSIQSGDRLARVKLYGAG